MARERSPKVVANVASMQDLADEVRASGRTLALVPTMGGLHAGHLALVRRAKQECDQVAVSIFVNPAQFGSGEDYSSYPGSLETDLESLTAIGGVDAVFAPAPSDLFPDGIENMQTWLEAPSLTRHLCGPHRPGHFRGVLTIVAKLFNCCKPHAVVFGLKDAQQYFLLRRMVDELDFGIRVIGVETVREPDGLAMSTRNLYLSEAERTQACVLSRSVRAAHVMIVEGERDPHKVVHAMHEAFVEAPLARLEYAELVSTTTLAPVSRIGPGQAMLAAVAARVGNARLIDNTIALSPQDD